MTTRRFFSERRRGKARRDVDDIGSETASSLMTIVNRELLNTEYYSELPKICTYCDAYYVVNGNRIMYRASRDIHGIEFDSKSKTLKITESMAIFDLIELCYDEVAPRLSGECIECSPECGRVLRRNMYCKLINRILERDAIAFELSKNGDIERYGAPILSELIKDAVFQTGDEELDELLETESDKFINRDPAIRREGLEKLWDAWERLKTLEVPGAKKASATALLDRVASGAMRDRLECEAHELTKIGNEFMIRHSEVGKHPLDDGPHVDYLFHRLFSMVYLVLDGTGRIGASK